MKAGACDACVLEMRCCGMCWCCPWPALWDHCYEEVTRDGWAEACGREPVGTHIDDEGGRYPVCLKHLRDKSFRLLVGMVDLLHRRPELADRGGWVGSRPTLAGVLVQSMLWGA